MGKILIWLKEKIVWFLVALAGLAFVLLISRLFNPSGAFSPSVEVDWKMLGDYDYVSGKTANAELTSLNGKSVKVPGFMVPLEDYQKEVVDFLLVPTPQACVHVPPPPPNQMVLVKMQNKTPSAYGPIWVHGILKIETKETIYGNSSFQIEGVTIEPYKY